MMPWPLSNSIFSTSVGKPSDMITCCVPSGVVRVSSPALACDSRRRFERLLLEHLRALRDRGQRLRDLAQRVERGVELRGLARDRRENARVLDRDAGHRAELLQRGRILLVEPGGRVTAQADGAEHAVPAADWSKELIH